MGVTSLRKFPAFAYRMHTQFGIVIRMDITGGTGFGGDVYLLGLVDRLTYFVHQGLSLPAEVCHGCLHARGEPGPSSR